jgi:ABC-type spermidine/putrescine transport system permease subunit II
MSMVSGVSAARFKSSKRPNGPDQSGGTMATRQTQTLARLMMAPSVVLLFIWMIVPLAFTLWFSFQQYNPLNPIRDGFVGFSNYALFYSNPAFLYSIINTLLIVGSVLLITVIGGILLALLLDQPIFGQGIVRILVISPFFVMPPVAALVWKNMIMHPSYGVFADISRFLGVQPVDWFAQYPLFSVIIIVAWQWLPFATLILLTALQSLDGEQMEAADHRGHPDTDDLSFGGLCGNPGHHQWRPRLRFHQPALPRLPEGLARIQNRPGVGRRHHRCHPCQYRRLLRHARCWQEPGPLSETKRTRQWHALSARNARQSSRSRPGSSP